MKALRIALCMVEVFCLVHIGSISSDPETCASGMLADDIEDYSEFEEDVPESTTVDLESEWILPEPTYEIVEISYDDAQILMRIAAAEATGGTVEDKALVMAVVMNRVNDDSGNFPDTVEGVVFQKNQFSPISDGRYWSVEIDEDCHRALASIEMGLYNDFKALFFDNCKNSWASKHRTFIARIGNHNFYE